MKMSNRLKIYHSRSDITIEILFYHLAKHFRFCEKDRKKLIEGDTITFRAGKAEKQCRVSIQVGYILIEGETPNEVIGIYLQLLEFLDAYSKMGIRVIV